MNDKAIKQENQTTATVGGPGRALVMCISDPAIDPRPRRMIDLLHTEGYLVDVLTDFASHPNESQIMAIAYAH